MAYQMYPTVILPIRRNRQDKTYDCGPASLKIILETINHSVSEERLMRLGRTSPEEGTSPQHLLDTLSYLGIPYHTCHGENVTHIEEEIRKLRLVLVDYQSWGKSGEEYANLDTGHYSVVFGYSKTHLYIADPSKTKTPAHDTWGFRTIKKELFGERWIDKESDGTVHKQFMISVPLSYPSAAQDGLRDMSLLQRATQFYRDALTKGAKI